MTNGKRRTQSAARIAALSVLSLVVMAVVLTTTASATIMGPQTGNVTIPSGSSMAYAMPLDVSYILSSGDDSDNPALGGRLYQYANPSRWIMGSGSINTAGRLQGSYYMTSYTLHISTVGLARLTFAPFLVDGDVGVYMPQFTVNPDSYSEVQPDGYGFYFTATSRVTYVTGASKVFTYAHSIETTTNNTTYYVSSYYNNLLAQAVADPMNETQGGVLAMSLDIDIEPFQVENGEPVRGYTNMWLQITNDNADPMSEIIYNHYYVPKGSVLEVPVLEDSGSWFEWLVDAVSGLMNAPLFGEHFTLGLLLAVPLIALVVLGFLRLFAGG